MVKAKMVMEEANMEDMTIETDAAKDHAKMDTHQAVMAT